MFSVGCWNILIHRCLYVIHWTSQNFPLFWCNATSLHHAAFKCIPESVAPCNSTVNSQVSLCLYDPRLPIHHAPATLTLSLLFRFIWRETAINVTGHPVNTLYLLQSIFGIIWQDENDLAVRILSQNPLFLPSLKKEGENNAKLCF